MNNKKYQQFCVGLDIISCMHRDLPHGDYALPAVIERTIKHACLYNCTSDIQNANNV